MTAVLRGGQPGPTVLLRGDMDALPVTERTGPPFSSQIDGMMHAGKGDVYSQDPRPGTAAQPGQAVNLIEASGLNSSNKPCITE